MLMKLVDWFVSICPKKLQDIYYKYENVWLYLYFGALATFMSLATQYLAAFVLTKWGYNVNDGIPNVICTTFSWVITVSFAFYTNKTYVFKSKSETRKDFMREFIAFYGARLATYFMEIGIMLLFATLLRWNYYLVKFGAQFLILIGNYIFSKLVVFRKPKKKAESAAAEETE
ncbi:MAG: GtrA family protein [Ruminococcus sp.]|nr:GtrA family protein [Ruminococcus sp.]MBQ8906019.1 GtrA family protein [Ruminococcus sp.]